MQKDRTRELVGRALAAWCVEPPAGAEQAGVEGRAELEFALQEFGITDCRARLDARGEVQLTLAAVALAKELQIAEETCTQLERENADLVFDLEDKEEAAQTWQRKYERLHQQHLDDIARFENMLQAEMPRDNSPPKADCAITPLSSTLMSMRFNDSFRSREYDTLKSLALNNSQQLVDTQFGGSDEDLDQRLQDAYAENAALKADFNALKVELQDLNSQEAIRKDMETEMTRTIEQLKKQIDQLTCAGGADDHCQCRHCQELREEITALEQALMWERENKISSVSSKQTADELEERLAGLRTKNEDLKTKAAALERSLNSKNAENAQLQASITYLTNQVENLTEDAERSKKALSEAEARISSMKAAALEYTGEVRRMPSCISISGDLLVDPSPQRSPSTRGSPTASELEEDDEVRKLRLKLKAMMTRVDALNSELLNARAELKTALQKQFLTQAKSEEQLNALMDEKLRLTTQLQDMEPQLVSISGENARLAGELDQMLTSKKALQERVNQLEREGSALAAKFNDSDVIHSDLRKRIKELEHELSYYESLASANDRLKDQIGTLESERKVLAEKVSSWFDFVRESIDAALATDAEGESDSSPRRYFRSDSATSRIGESRKKSPLLPPAARYSSDLVDLLGESRSILQPIVSDLVVLSQGTMRARKPSAAAANKKLDSLASRMLSTSLDPNVDILTQLKSPLLREIWKRILRQQRYGRRSSVDVAGMQLANEATKQRRPRRRTTVSFGTGWDRVTRGSRRCGRWIEGFTLCLSITYEQTDKGLMESVRTWSCKRSLPIAEIHSSRVMYSEEHLESARRAMPLLKYIDRLDEHTPSTARP